MEFHSKNIYGIIFIPTLSEMLRKKFHVLIDFNQFSQKKRIFFEKRRAVKY